MQRFALLLSAAGGVGIVLVLAWLIALAPDRAVLARAGDERLTVDEFQRLAERWSAGSPLPPDSAKVALAEDWLRRALLLASARRNPVVIDSLVRQFRERTENEILVNALAQRLTLDEPRVSEAELRRFWESRAQESHVQIVYAVDERMMRAGLAALANGEPFTSVADRFSVPGMLPPGGDVGFVVPGALVNPLDQLVQTAPVGEIAGPIEAPGEGWFLVRVLERRPREQGTFESEARQLRGMLTQRKQRTVAIRAFQALRDQYAVRVADDGVALLFHHLNTPPLIQGFGGEAAPAPPTPEERLTVLGTWDGGGGATGRYTLGDALDDLDAGRGQRPNPTMTPALEQWVSGRILEKAAQIEARRRRLDQEPAVARQIRESVDGYILEGALQAEIGSASPPTPDELEAVYRENAAAIATLRSVTVQRLTLPDSGSAARAYEQVRPHPTLKEAVLLASAGMQVREETVRFPNPDPLWTAMEGAFRGAPLGTLFPPIQGPDGWRLVQLTGRDMPAPPLAELPANVQQTLFQEATQRARQRRLEAYTDSLRRVIPWSLDRAALRRVRWPIAPMSIGG